MLKVLFIALRTIVYVIFFVDEKEIPYDVTYDVEEIRYYDSDKDEAYNPGRLIAVRVLYCGKF